MKCPICKNEDFKRIIRPIKDVEIIHRLKRNFYLIDVCLCCGADFGVLVYPVKLS